MDVTLVDVVVVVDDPICSSREMHVIDGKKYETCVVLGMSRSPFVKPGHSKFQGVRYMQHSRHETYYRQVWLPNAPFWLHGTGNMADLSLLSILIATPMVFSLL